MSLYAATTPRLHLQPLSESLHLSDLHLMMADEKAMMWSTKSLYTDIEQTRALIQESMPTKEKPWNERWAILLRSPPAVNGVIEDGVGNGGEHERKEVNGEGEKGKLRMIGIIGIVREQEIGYKIHPDFWGKGFMSEALAAFIKMFFTDSKNEKYDRLLAAADPENHGSMRVLEKAGFLKAEYKVEFYERGSLRGKKSDLQFFYFPRPSEE